MLAHRSLAHRSLAHLMVSDKTADLLISSVSLNLLKSRATSSREFDCADLTLYFKWSAGNFPKTLVSSKVGLGEGTRDGWMVDDRHKKAIVGIACQPTDSVGPVALPSIQPPKSVVSPSGSFLTLCVPTTPPKTPPDSLALREREGEITSLITELENCQYWPFFLLTHPTQQRQLL